MYKNLQKGFAHIFLILFILLGIIGSVYLVQQKTNIFSKASGPSVASATNQSNREIVEQIIRSHKDQEIIDPNSYLKPTRRFSSKKKTGFLEQVKGISFNFMVSAANETPDLDAAYISRTPRYERFDVVYQNDLPVLNTGTENKKRWPDVGETVTYQATVINKGKAAIQGFSYKWLVNNEQVSTGNFSSGLAPGQETQISYSNTFPNSPQNIKFEVSPLDSITEITTNNNSLSITSHDLTFSIWVEQGLYDRFNQKVNLIGSYSFEDWVQAHIAKMHERFTQAIYPTSPQGIKDRLRIDKVVIQDNIDDEHLPEWYDGPRSTFGYDPELLLFDGRWPFSDGDETNFEGNNGEYETYVNSYAGIIDWGLIHELIHQLGIIDLYHLGIPASEGVDITNHLGIKVEHSEFLNNGIVHPNPGIMGGGDTSPYNDGTYIDAQTAAALNSNYLKRRGYFGEYLYDMPTNIKVRLLGKNNFPIPNAQIFFYQKSFTSPFYIDNTPEIQLTSDTSGEVSLPNRSIPQYTTANGHVIKNNPFGKLLIWGPNSTMVVRVLKGEFEGYGYLTTHDLNLAYYAGQGDNALIYIKTNFYDNLLRNGEFNGPYDPNATIPVWTTSNQYSGDWVCRKGGTLGGCTYDHEMIYLGNYSVKVENNGGSTWGYQIGQGYFNVQPEERLCIRGWVKKSNPDMQVTIAIQELALSYTHEANVSQAHDDWQELKRTVWSKPNWSDGGTKIQFFARARTTGTAWFDDLSLTRGECN